MLYYASMSYTPESAYESTYPFDINPNTAVDIPTYQARLALWHSGAPINLDGGVVVAKVQVPNEQISTLLNNSQDVYTQLSIPGSGYLLGAHEKRFKSLAPQAKAVVYGLHATFREIVRLDAERSSLLAPNAIAGTTSIGLFSGEDNWHCDGWTSSKTDMERSDQLFGNGLLRYTLSVGAPGTELLAGRLQKNQIVDGFLLDETTRTDNNLLESTPHSALEVVRFVSDYDVHRAPRLKTAIARYFTTASVLLPLSEASRVQVSIA